MSFVSIILTEKFISVMSDGLVTNNGEIKQQDFCKFQEFGEREGFLAGTGNKAKVEEYMNTAKEWFDLGLPLPWIANEIQKKLIAEIPFATYPQYLTNVAIGGNFEGELVVYSLSSKFQSVEQIERNVVESKDGIVFIKMESPEFSSLQMNLNLKLIGLLQEYRVSSTSQFTPLQIMEAQKQLNSFVADVDNTVNNTTFHLLVNKK